MTYRLIIDIDFKQIFQNREARLGMTSSKYHILSKQMEKYNNLLKNQRYISVYLRENMNQNGVKQYFMLIQPPKTLYIPTYTCYLERQVCVISLVDIYA